MRVLMISDVYFPRVNGVSTSIQTFARELVAAGQEVTLIAPDYGRSAPESFEVLRIPSLYLPLDPEDRILRPGRLRAHRARLAAQTFDLVHIHTPFVAHYTGTALARRLGIPVVETYHTFFEQYLDKYVPVIPSAWLRLAARRFSRRPVQRRRCPRRPLPGDAGGPRRLWGQGPGPSHSHRNRAGTVRLRRRRALPARHGIPEERPVLVHVGRLAYEKNIDFLLRVLARVGS